MMSLFFNKNITIIFTILFTSLIFQGCAHQSSRDSISDDFVTYERSPANWSSTCIDIFSRFIKPKPEPSKTLLPELTQLNSVIKKFPNGRNYIEYVANINVMQKYPDYNEFLKNSVEIIFEPTDPFGHINLRIGEYLYSFNYIKSISMNRFSPRLKKSSNPEMASGTGFVFAVDQEVIKKLKNEIDNFYRSSASHNIPPFDAYSPLLKIVETESAFGKTMKYETTSPKHGNTSTLNGKISEEANTLHINTDTGIKLPLIKKGSDIYIQSYSCSSSAAFILEKHFGITLSQAFSAKSLYQSLIKGNINEPISPKAIIKYYEE